MKKQLLKNLIFGVALVVSSLSQAQMIFEQAYTASPETTLVDPTGILEKPLIFTLSNIPNSTVEANVINVRLYPVAEGSGTGNHIAQLSNSDLTVLVSTADVDNAQLKTVTQLETPSTGSFTRTYTIKKIPLKGTSTIDNAAEYYISFRIVQGDAGGTAPIAGGISPADDGNSKHIIWSFPAADFDVTGSAISLGTVDLKRISRSIYPNPVKKVLHVSNDIDSVSFKIVSILGQTIKEVNSTNRKIDVSDLTNGIYLLVTDAGVAKFVKN